MQTRDAADWSVGHEDAVFIGLTNHLIANQHEVSIMALRMKISNIALTR